MPTIVANPPDASALMTSARSFGNYDLAGVGSAGGAGEGVLADGGRLVVLGHCGFGVVTEGDDWSIAGWLGSNGRKRRLMARWRNGAGELCGRGRPSRT